LGVESGSNGSHEERALAGRIPVLRRLMDGPSLIEGRQWQGLVEGGTRGFPCLDLSLALRWTVLDSPVPEHSPVIRSPSRRHSPLSQPETPQQPDSSPDEEQPRRPGSQSGLHHLLTSPERAPQNHRAAAGRGPNSALAALVTLAIHLTFTIAQNSPSWGVWKTGLFVGPVSPHCHDHGQANK
jgi:hypothetical protein